MIRTVTVDIDRLVLDRGMSRWERAALADAVADELGQLLGAGARPQTPAPSVSRRSVGGSALATDIARAIHAELSSGAPPGLPAAPPAAPSRLAAGDMAPVSRASPPSGGPR